MLINKIEKKWREEREKMNYINQEYGRLIDLFVQDLDEIKREFEKYKDIADQIEEYNGGKK